MTCRLVLTFLLLAASLGAELSAAEKEITRDFAVAPGCTLQIDTQRGDILIEESERNEVRIAIRIDAVAASDAAAARLLEQVQVDLGLHENQVTIKARNPRESGWRFTWSEDERVDFSFRISVPRECHVDLRAIKGWATVGNLTGRMKARIEDGGVFFRRIEGTVDARVDYGDVIVSRCSGAVQARVLRGQIRMGTLGGRAELTNATGDIEVMMVRDSIVAETQVGEIRVGFAPGLAADSRLAVAGGNINAEFHGQLACRIDAAATWGRVNSTLPWTVDSGGSGQRSLVGRLKGGGPLIHLRASGGSVTLDRSLLLLDGETEPEFASGSDGGRPPRKT